MCVNKWGFAFLFFLSSLSSKFQLCKDIFGLLHLHFAHDPICKILSLFLKDFTAVLPASNYFHILENMVFLLLRFSGDKDESRPASGKRKGKGRGDGKGHASVLWFSSSFHKFLLSTSRWQWIKMILNTRKSVTGDWMSYQSPSIIKEKVVFLLPSVALTCPLAIVSPRIVSSFLFPPLLPAYCTSVVHMIKGSAGIKTLMAKYQCGFKT